MPSSVIGDRIPLDKLKHIAAGAVIAWAVTLFAAPIWGILAAFVAGALKDVVYDRIMGRGVYDPRDIWATVIGAALYTAGGASVLLQLLF